MSEIMVFMEGVSQSLPSINRLEQPQTGQVFNQVLQWFTQQPTNGQKVIPTEQQTLLPDWQMLSEIGNQLPLQPQTNAANPTVPTQALATHDFLQHSGHFFESFTSQGPIEGKANHPTVTQHALTINHGAQLANELQHDLQKPPEAAQGQIETQLLPAIKKAGIEQHRILTNAENAGVSLSQSTAPLPNSIKIAPAPQSVLTSEQIGLEKLPPDGDRQTNLLLNTDQERQQKSVEQLASISKLLPHVREPLSDGIQTRQTVISSTVSPSVDTAVSQFNTVSQTPGKMSMPTQSWTIETPIHDKNWSSALNDRVLMAVRNQVPTAELKLTPPELGALMVKLEISNDQVNVTFNSPNASVRDVIDTSLLRLREGLDALGLQLGHVDISSGQNSDTNTNQSEMASAANLLDEASASDETVIEMRPQESKVDIFA